MAQVIDHPDTYQRSDPINSKQAYTLISLHKVQYQAKPSQAVPYIMRTINEFFPIFIILLI